MTSSLNKNQLLTWQQAYEWLKLDKPKYIMGWDLKKHKDFLEPFLKAKLINKDHLKFAGAFVLTPKGVKKFEELKEQL